MRKNIYEKTPTDGVHEIASQKQKWLSWKKRRSSKVFLWSSGFAKIPVWVFSCPIRLRNVSHYFSWHTFYFFIGLHTHPGWQSLKPKNVFWGFSCPHRLRHATHFFSWHTFHFPLDSISTLGGKIQVQQIPFGFFHAQIDSEMFTTFSHDTHSIFHWTPDQPWDFAHHPRNNFPMPTSIFRKSSSTTQYNIAKFPGIACTEPGATFVGFTFLRISIT